MKSFLPTGAIIICLAGSALRAQDAALPKPEPQVPVEPALLVTPSPAPSIPAPLLMPNELLPPAKDADGALGLPTIPQLDAGFKPPPLSPASDLQRKRVEWRRIRNGIRNERDVKAALKVAEQAETDLEKRTLLRRYYDLLFRKAFARAAPEMKDYLADRKKEALLALSQPRVRPDDAEPSSSSSPTGTPSSLPTASPSEKPESPSAPDVVQP